MWRLGRHLGTAASALVDGQLAPGEAEQAWEHVLHCPPCQRLVEREGWTKRQLSSIASKPAAPADALPERLLGSLYDLGPGGPASASPEAMDAWAAVDELEARGRTRRRVGIALVGAGSVSAAVLGFSTLSSAPLGIGEAPASTPATSLSRGAATPVPTRAVVAPRATVHGRLAGWTVARGEDGAAHAVPVETRR
jgi:hypothetical protein